MDIGKVDWKWLAIGVGLGIVIRHFVPDYLQSFPAQVRDRDTDDIHGLKD